MADDIIHLTAGCVAAYKDWLAMEGARMSRPRSVLAASLVAVLLLSGCGAGRHFTNKPWGKGTYIPAIVCALVGAGVGVAIQDARPGTSTGTVVNPDGSTRTEQVSDDPEYWKGAVVGAPIGAVLCGLAGHYLFDPEVTPTPAPPPPPAPTPAPPPPPVSRRIVLRGVNFDFDKSTIRPDSRPVLDEAVDVLKENPNVRISVEGHTDGVGSDLYNEKLSVRRAEAVFRYLVNNGIAPERMEVIGYGESRPVASNDTDSGRAQNRRVELHVVQQPAGSPP
jgi:outer membrane protein OmpA-like peptidoglycan-associated protein